MITKTLTIVFILLSSLCYVQKDSLIATVDTFQSNIEVYKLNGVFHFKPILRPLVQIPGGRTPYYKYLWDFGDGHFST